MVVKGQGKKKGGGGKKGGGASLAKLSNKRLNKLAKQGKLKKRLPDKKYIGFLKERTQGRVDPELAAATREAEEQEEADIPLEEADYEFFATPGRSLDFLHIKEEKNVASRKRKRKDNKTDAEEAYEAVPRIVQGTEKLGKPLLPIKNKDKLIQRNERVVEKVKTEEEKDVDAGEDETSVKPPEPLPALSIAEILASRQTKLTSRKAAIARLAGAVMENPQGHIGKLKELRLLLDDDDPVILVTSKKFVMLSLSEVFCDIIPSYRIRIASEAEKQQQAKKETKELREFEEALLKNYRQYLEFLEFVVKGQPPKTKDRSKRSKTRYVKLPEDALVGLREVALKCLCSMLVNQPHFNFRTNIITIVVPYTNSQSEVLANLVCGAVKKIFSEDRVGEVSLELVRLIGRMIKAREFKVQPRVLETFLSLRIREIQKEEDKPESKEERREKIRKMSKRERKNMKQMGDLKKELDEAAITSNKENKLKVNTETMNMLFLTSFRILKRGRNSLLMAPVLAVLAKFAHFIDVDFFSDLFAVLSELVVSNELSYRESLHCIQTAFTIISGQGSSLSVDPLAFYQHLYRVLLSVHAGASSPNLPAALSSIHTGLVTRKKQVSVARVLAFVKRLSTVALHQASHGALAVMATLRTVLHSAPRCSVLFDTESLGSGFYQPELDDPEHCNAASSALWELTLLQRHYHPTCARYAAHLAQQAPSQGAGALPADLARLSHGQLLAEFDTALGHLHPDMERAVKGKKRAVVVRDGVLAPGARYLSEETPLEGLDFYGHYTHSVAVTVAEPMDGVEPVSQAIETEGTVKPRSRNKAKKKAYMARKIARERKGVVK